VDRDPYTVGIVPGDGLVVRTGDVVMYIADTSLSADSLITAVESAAGAEQPGSAIAERLAALAFGADSGSVAPFGVLAPTANGVLVLLRGNVIAQIDTADGIRELSGARALTWVDEVLPRSARRVTIGGRPPLVASKHSDLRTGVVPGGGFVLQPAAAATQPSPALRADEGQAEGATILNAAAARDRPITEPPPAAPPTEAVPPVQRRRTPTETSTLAPIAGVLESAEGAVFPLDRPYVIGRDPLGDEAVRNAHASPIVVHDDQHVSRVHAYVTIDGGSVYVRDAATPGGTFIAAPGADTWTQISTTPTELEPGWTLRVGARILTYRSAD
jgi:hypothetical protein